MMVASQKVTVPGVTDFPAETILAVSVTAVPEATDVTAPPFEVTVKVVVVSVVAAAGTARPRNEQLARQKTWADTARKLLILRKAKRFPHNADLSVKVCCR